MELPRRDLLKRVTGLTAASMLVPAAASGQQVVASNERAAAQSEFPFDCFANLNQVQRYQYTGKQDLVGRRRFAFLDTRQIRDVRDADLKFHAARKHGDPVLVADRAMETGVGLYGTVLHDGQRFRMWYQPIGTNQQRGNPYSVACAESTDGIHWERPELGIVKYNGSVKNSLTNLRGHGPSVIDLGTAVPADKRYLGIAVGYAPLLGVPEVLQHASTRRHHGYWMYYSADGLNWRVYPPPTCAIFNYMSDTACFVHDPYRQRVIGSVKLEPRVRLFDRRSITISTAPNDRLQQWESPRLAIYPDELDDRMAAERGCRFAEFYGMGLFPQRDYLVGFPEVYWVEGELHPSQAPGIRLGFHGKAEIQMAYSADGQSWHRTVGRQPFIPLGKPGDWDDGFLTMQSSVVEVGDEVYCYYSGNRGGHSDHRETSQRKIGLATIKRDRFASMSSTDPGMVEVYHGQVAGKEMVINGRTTAAGEIRVEVRRVQGKGSVPVAGFGREQSASIRGDDVRLKASWKGASWANLANGANYAIRFYLKDADLFAYEIM